MLLLRVRELFDIPCLKGSEVIAGEKGLDKSIFCVDIIEVPDADKWVTPGTFLLTTAYAYREDYSRLEKLVKVLAEGGVSGLGIKVGRFIQDVPEEVIRTADHLDFPIILLPLDLPYVSVIKEVMQVIFERERLIRKSFDNQQILQKFLSEGFSEEEYIEFLHEHDLSPDSLCSCLLLEFSENMGRRESNFLIWEVIENTRPDWSKFFVAEGKGDFKIIFVMEDERDFFKVKKKIPPLISSFQNQGNSCLAGLSGLHGLAGGLKESCREARFSLKAAKRLRNSKTGFVDFDDFSHLYFLFTHPNKKEIVKTSLEVLEPLLKYDAKNHSSLMNTLKVFLLSDCNQKKAAERLHLHRNSLRYRLGKIEEILGNDTFSGLKLQKLFLATSIYEIWKDDDPGTQESGRSTLS